MIWKHGVNVDVNFTTVYHSPASTHLRLESASLFTRHFVTVIPSQLLFPIEMNVPPDQVAGTKSRSSSRSITTMVRTWCPGAYDSTKLSALQLLVSTAASELTTVVWTRLDELSTHSDVTVAAHRGVATSISLHFLRSH